jgi:two-component system NarL family sensor kinase
MAEAIERTRKLTFDLRPQLLEAEGLSAAVASLGRDAAEHANFDVHLDLNVGRHSDVIESLAVRTIQEALANIQRHADPTHVHITLREDGGVITGTITDNGVGFAALTTRTHPRRFRCRVTANRTVIGAEASGEYATPCCSCDCFVPSSPWPC